MNKNNEHQRAMYFSLKKIVIFLLVTFSISVAAETLPELRISVLQSGTVNWELQYLKDQGYDHQNGFNLVIDKVASLSAARLALTSDSADMIVSDWLWAGKRNIAGDQLRFIPFSSQIGSIIISPDQKLEGIASLKGKNIGVAGGPLNKGWVLLQTAARDAGVDLQKNSKVQFGAPPLLSQALKRGQVDVLVTFWHYGARLETEGYQRWLSLEEVMSGLGMESRVPMLGYIFKSALFDRHPELASSFTQAIAQTKADLLENDAIWTDLKPLMKAEDEHIYKALINGYRNGTPKPLNDQQIKDAVKFFGLIDQLSAHPSGEKLDPVLFRTDR